MLTFGAMNVLGDPLFNILGPVGRATPTTPRASSRSTRPRREYNLDKPLPVRYVMWLGDFVTGDFGRAVQQRRSAAGVAT